jgi:hypothetical protein
MCIRRETREKAPTIARRNHWIFGPYFLTAIRIEREELLNVVWCLAMGSKKNAIYRHIVPSIDELVV